ncbi:hypothetical protein [Compostibacter hankyongensis]
MEKQYEILDALPTYGPMHISITDNEQPFYSEGFPVRLYKTDGTNWVANFKPGWTDLRKVIELENTQNLLVISGGTCYLMNPNHTQPILAFGTDYNNIFEASNNRLVLQDLTGLTIIEPDGAHWDTERISWDGLKDLKVESNIVSGLAFDPIHDDDEWAPFSYNLDTRTWTGGSYNNYAHTKPWWKLWK